MLQAAFKSQATLLFEGYFGMELGRTRRSVRALVGRLLKG